MPIRNLDQFFIDNRTKGQSFVIDPARRTTVVGSLGTRLTIAPNAFLDASGWPVADSVTLFLHEVFTRPEMILSGLTNTSEDRIMESAGQVLLDARGKQGAYQLATPISIDLPLQHSVDNPLATQLFVGGVSQTSSYGSGSRFDWKSVKHKNISLKTLGSKKYLNFFLNELNWWNCTSFFHRRRSRIMMSVRWSDTDLNIEDIAAFLVFRDFNAVVRMYPGRHGFSSWNIPKEVVAKAVIIGVSEGKMLIGASPWAATSSQPVSVQLDSCTTEDVLRLIPEWCQ